jgi:hypothetical protein
MYFLVIGLVEIVHFFESQDTWPPRGAIWVTLTSIN